MQKIIFSILFAFVSVVAFSQKTLEKGTVIMEITNVSSPDEQAAMMMEVMKGSQTQITFEGDKYASKMDMMGGMVQVKTFVDKKNNTFDMLMDAMGKKTWVNSALDKAESPEAKKVSATAKVEYDKNAKKTIAGYECYKAVITSPENPDTKVECYITESLKTSANIIQGFNSVKLDGFPMEFSMINKMMTLTMAAKEVKDSVDEKAFLLQTDGYEKMTMEDFAKSMGGGFGM